MNNAIDDLLTSLEEKITIAEYFTDIIKNVIVIDDRDNEQI